MPQLIVSESVEIQAPLAKVWNIVSDLAQFRQWNPWIITEPSTEVSVTDDGQRYRWKGNRTGEGDMLIVQREEKRSLDLDLTFVKPFKNTAKVRFELSGDDEKSVVTWKMNGSLPFFLFFLTKTMTTMLSMDYQRGLKMLKSYAETGAVPSVIEDAGERQFPGLHYIAVESNSDIGDLGSAMTGDIEKLLSLLKSAGVSADGPGFTIYKKWDLAAKKCTYATGFPLESAWGGPVPDGFATGRLGEMRARVLTHQGPWEYLGNAWSTGMAMVQNKEFKQSKGNKPFEMYLDTPDSADPEKVRTEIWFPLA